MADAPSGGGGKVAGEGTAKGLGRKLGPLPIWAWGAIAVAGYYWYTHYGPGAKSQQAAQQPGTQQAAGGGGGLGRVVVNIRDTITQTITRTAPGGPPPRDRDRRDRDRKDRDRRRGVPPVTSPPSQPPGIPPITSPPSQGAPPATSPPSKPPGRDRDRQTVAVSHPSQQVTVTSTGGRPPATAAPQPPQPVYAEANTQGGPLYMEWVADGQGVPEPVQAYAPLTAGAVYG